MKTYYRDFYGATASIEVNRDDTATLSVSSGGKRFRKTYNTYKGARIALGKWSDSWQRRYDCERR